MAIVVPTLNAASASEFRERARIIRTLGSHWVQVDVADGVLGAPKNFAEPRVAAEALQGLKVEVHLMVQDAAAFVQTWEPMSPKRITVHLEALSDPRALCQRLAAAHIECGLAIRPWTPVEALGNFAETADVLLLVGVPPGPSGQPFDPETPARVRALRASAPRAVIGVDGGVKPAHVPGLLAAGASVLCVGAAIFQTPDPQAAYQELRTLVEKG